MSRRTVFTTVTPLPAYVSRDTIMKTLRDHLEMIDLNPLVIDRHQMDSAPSFASPEQLFAKWYSITDKITYMPGIQSSVTYHACMHDLADGLQTHTRAPAGVEIKGRWTVGGSLPGEPREEAELGLDVPRQGLYLKEEVDLRCNFLLTGFVKKNLKKSHGQLVQRMLQNARDNEPRPPVPPKEQGHSGNDSQEPVELASDSQHVVPTESQFDREPSDSTCTQSQTDLNSASNMASAQAPSETFTISAGPTPDTTLMPEKLRYG